MEVIADPTEDMVVDPTAGMADTAGVEGMVMATLGIMVRHMGHTHTIVNLIK